MCILKADGAEMPQTYLDVPHARMARTNWVIKSLNVFLFLTNWIGEKDHFDFFNLKHFTDTGSPPQHLVTVTDSLSFE